MYHLKWCLTAEWGVMCVQRWLMIKVGKSNFMPRYGNINETSITWVIRLSGMNLVVNDLDMPLIIKVASIPKERIQVYFIDNDEYLKESDICWWRRSNVCRQWWACYFLCKRIVETVKKLNWVPDIHVHGWMAAMLPIYMKHYYKMKRCFLIRKLLHQCTVSRLKEL
jgi:starch synthase